MLLYPESLISCMSLPWSGSVSRALPLTKMDRIEHVRLCSLATNGGGSVSAWTSALLLRAKDLRSVLSSDERWSLTECLLREEDWADLLVWGKECPSSAVPDPETVVGGLMFLALSTAVARTLNGHEPLWTAVADQMNSALLRSYFGSSTYPLETTRRFIRHACEQLHLRHQTDLPGKHRYWRTVMLQIGFTPKAAAERLPIWLLGYGLPESISTLLQTDDANCSTSFRALWDGLRKWQRGEVSEQLRGDVLCNSWFPVSGTDLDNLQRKSHVVRQQLRLEDEDDTATLFGTARLDGDRFLLALSPTPPAVFLGENPMQYQIRIGDLVLNLIRAEHSPLRIEGGSHVRVDRASRELEVKVFEGGDFVYREQVQLWQQEDDITIFSGRNGQRVRDVHTFVAEARYPYTILTPADVVLFPAAERIESENDEWRFHVYPDGLPEGLTAFVEGSPLWTLASTAGLQTRERGGTLELRAESMVLTRLRAVPSLGQTVQSFRVARQTFFGSAGSAMLSPAVEWDGRMVPATLEGGQRIELEMSTDEEASGAAYLDQTGAWVTLDASGTLDGADLEGRKLVIRWRGRRKRRPVRDSDWTEREDCWLMIGDQPIRSQPDVVRSQQLRGMGEPLTLRFGLMHQHRSGLTLAATTVYTGQLRSVQRDGAWYRLELREPSMRAADYRVHVWERGSSVPRVLARTEVECDPQGAVLSIMRDSAPAPLGWAVSLDRLWKGSRFHVNQATGEVAWASVCEGWLEIFGRQSKRDGAWEALAVCLRWWKFPVLMQPFVTVIEARVRADPSATFRAWVRAKDGGCIVCPLADNDFLIPFRTLLWRYRPESAICSTLLAGLWRRGSEVFADMYGLLFPELRFLLSCNPILLAHMVCEAILELERDELRKNTAVPVDRKHIEEQSRVLRHLFVQRVSEWGGVTADGRSALPLLEAKALGELRSWTERTNLDSTYFHRHVIRPAEAVFHGDHSADSQLRIAIARSPAARAFITYHLVEKFGVVEVLR